MFVEFYGYTFEANREVADIGDAMEPRDRDEYGRGDQMDAAVKLSDEAGRIPYADLC